MRNKKFRIKRDDKLKLNKNKNLKIKFKKNKISNMKKIN